jgi:autotransporter-associated beta strand protein
LAGSGTLVTGIGTITGTTGAGTVTTVAAGTTLQGTADSLPLDILDYGEVVFLQGSDGTYEGTISGSGNVTKKGAGTLTFDNANTFTGVLSFDGGAIAAASLADLGDGSGFSFDGGGLRFLGSFNVGQAIALNAGNGTFDTNGQQATLSGVLSGTGALVKTGAGVLTLTGSDYHQGGFVVNGGTLRLGSGEWPSSPGALTVNAGTFDLNGHSVSLPTIAGSGGVIALGGGNLTVGGTAGSSSFAGAITGSGMLIEYGSGYTLTLTGANTYTGGTTLYGGILRLGAGGSLLAGGALALGGGTFDIGGGTQTLGSVTGSSGSVTLSGGTLIDASVVSLAAGLQLSGYGWLQATVDGPGILAASGGKLEVLGSLADSAATDIRIGSTAGTVLKLDAPVGSASVHPAVTFGGGNSVLDLSALTLSDFHAVLLGFGQGEGIRLAGAASATLDASGRVLTVLDASGNALGNLTLGASYAGASFTVSNGLLTVQGTVDRTLDAAGTASLLERGSQFLLEDAGSDNGEVLRFQGQAVSESMLGAWRPIAAEKSDTGYALVWQDAATGQFALWQADAAGNLAPTAQGPVTGSSLALETLETQFQQDLNGDGTVGVAQTVIESAGATQLVQSADEYDLLDNGTHLGPALTNGGNPVTAGEFGDWHPIGAAKTSTGYQVVWRSGASDSYTVWNVDSWGHYQSDPYGTMSGLALASQGFENEFEQDLNGDGTIGVQGQIIESSGNTQLVEMDNAYLLLDSTQRGPVLTYQGAPVTAGEFGSWHPISAERMGSGYEVVWQNGVAGQYMVWTTDANGAFASIVISSIAGSSLAFEQLETTFQQDLNGDGTIGVVTTTIESAGATQLVQRADQFLLWDANNNGPTLSYGGSPVTAGEFSAWRPIGAEKTASGYEVAWRFGGADQYTIWNTDTAGNFVNDPVGVLSGESLTLQGYETSFQQDLNGDGTIGVVETAIGSAGPTLLMQRANQFSLSIGGHDGPSLSYGGAPVTAGEFGDWRPIGVEKTASGYEVAWQFGTADQYTIWDTDAGGAMVSNTVGVVSGSSFAIESRETAFQQDLNGDGTIGVVETTIENAGATQLVQRADEFSLWDANHDGPTLGYGGAPVTAGEFGAWRPIGAEKTATGYEVAWQFGTADQYTIWDTDAGGAMVSNTVGVVSGSSFAIESRETAFQQDLNGDGKIGVVETTIESAGATQLVQRADEFVLWDANRDGPTLGYGGAPVTAGEFDAWHPIGAEKTASGYELAWQFGTADQYTIWNTDAAGGFVNDPVGVLSGASLTAQGFDTSFHQVLVASK